MATIGNNYHNARLGMTLQGTSENDLITGLGGNDIILAGYHAGAWQNGNYGNDDVFGGTGDDFINYSWSRDSARIWGDGGSETLEDGNDTIYGSQGADTIYGGRGADTINGWHGDDTIYGDAIGAYSDVITGGLGSDTIWSGNGDDTFVYNYGDSPATYTGSDVIMDFNGIHDKIWTPGPVGTVGNYHEYTIDPLYSGALQFESAAEIADTWLDHSDDTYVFYTDGQQGYLFADTNMDGDLDFGIELKGLTSITQFSHLDLV
jgi:hypothetical protein